MKRLITLFIALCIGIAAQAQRPYFCITPGTTLEYQSYDNNGELSGITRTTIKSVEGANGSYEVSYSAQVCDAEGNDLMAPIEMTASIKDGNMSAALGNIGVEVTGDVPLIPSRLAVGQQLGTGTLKINTMGMTVTSTIETHKVVDREELETPAGTYKCYIVLQRTSSKVMGITAQGATQTWYARGIGAVKTETYDAKDNLVSYQILTGIK